ncbi:uncharacterized protein LAESUDRAFT_714688 [Laetiporus sulphureus 93-53]|uniref:Uncharacterized protein n=1 Tax=Laetiporus sulphureus 93-53 TaxID=1314785 RepID=A0A165DUW4_9APHY|nr:uncharacterized protein LAESUDRAFT_714688 [Laetiporus sulphureus 93-53]KZT05672.1 hypothetical protein LAESUDRAFT_714688 [Laetiporus sulphureus 93-53]
MSDNQHVVKNIEDNVLKAYQDLLPDKGDEPLVHYWGKNLKSGKSVFHTRRYRIQWEHRHGAHIACSHTAVPREDNPHHFVWKQTLEKDEEIPDSWDVRDESFFYGETTLVDDDMEDSEVCAVETDAEEVTSAVTLVKGKMFGPGSMNPGRLRDLGVSAGPSASNVRAGSSGVQKKGKKNNGETQEPSRKPTRKRKRNDKDETGGTKGKVRREHGRKDHSNDE